MGYGYAYNGNWAAITFKMSVNGGGDNVIYDIDGKNIIGYCYAKGTDGLWVGHGVGVGVGSGSGVISTGFLSVRNST